VRSTLQRHTHDYVRHGTTTLFAALDLATGAVTGGCYEKHRAEEVLDFLGWSPGPIRGVLSM
jgi:putative transposase